MLKAIAFLFIGALIVIGTVVLIACVLLLVNAILGQDKRWF